MGRVLLLILVVLLYATRMVVDSSKIQSIGLSLGSECVFSLIYICSISYPEGTGPAGTEIT